MLISSRVSGKGRNSFIHGFFKVVYRSVVGWNRIGKVGEHDFSKEAVDAQIAYCKEEGRTTWKYNNRRVCYE